MKACDRTAWLCYTKHKLPAGFSWWKLLTLLDLYTETEWTIIKNSNPKSKHRFETTNWKITLENKNRISEWKLHRIGTGGLELEPSDSSTCLKYLFFAVDTKAFHFRYLRFIVISCDVAEHQPFCLRLSFSGWVTRHVEFEQDFGNKPATNINLHSIANSYTQTHTHTHTHTQNTDCNLSSLKMRCKRLQMIPPGLPHVRIMCTVLELSLVGCLTWWLTTVWFECCPSSMYYYYFCVLDSGCEGSLWSSHRSYSEYLRVTTCMYAFNMGETRLKFESWKVTIHTQNASRKHFLLLSERYLNPEIRL